MSRAVLLPTPGDPFLLHYWLENYKRYYADEVNHLYVFLNTAFEKDIVDYALSLIENTPNATSIYVDHQIEHGDGINRLLDECKEDLVMLAEDDGYVFKKGLIDKCFRKIEEGRADLVGSKRQSCSSEISGEAKIFWNLSYEGYGDQGCNFWPCFLFTSKENLIKTDRRFGARSWKQGDTVEALGNYVIKGKEAVGDTLVNTSLQLRAMGLRIETLPQYHGSPYDLDEHAKNSGLWDGVAGWVHTGSLSSGINGVLIDDELRPLGNKKIQYPEFPNYCHTDGERLEWERRVQWWQMFYDFSEPDKIVELRDSYGKAINRLIKEYQLNTDNIRHRIKIYKQLGL